MTKKRVSLSLIAKEVGISKTVVSVVLSKKDNQKTFVSRETKKKVLAVADRLGYVPPKCARELSTGKSDTIGIIFHKLTPFFSELVTQLQQEAFRRHLEITPYITGGDAGLEEHYLNQIRDGRVDGVVTVARTKESAQLCRRFTAPPYNLKIVSYGPAIKKIATVHFDEEAGGELAYRHLKETGCRHPAAVAPAGNTARIEAFQKAAAGDGRRTTVFMGAAIDAVSIEQGLHSAKRFFDEVRPLPDGVFCFNDTMALAVSIEARRRGARVPDDISIVGCDNTETCFCAQPALTSIDTDIPALARTLLERMDQLIKGIPPTRMHTTIPVKIIERGSTKPRRAS